jgi:hypothetical protein
MAYLANSTECGISSSAMESALKNVPTLARLANQAAMFPTGRFFGRETQKGRNKNVSAAEFWPYSLRKDRKWAEFLKWFCVVNFFYMKPGIFSDFCTTSMASKFGLNLIKW